MNISLYITTTANKEPYVKYKLNKQRRTKEKNTWRKIQTIYHILSVHPHNLYSRSAARSDKHNKNIMIILVK